MRNINTGAILRILATALLFSCAAAALAQAPQPDPSLKRKGWEAKAGEMRSQRYSIEQAVSDRAQPNTIAFSGLAFPTGRLGADTFLPPAKSAGFFGFQYMRDFDASEAGHNMNFLTRIANNMLFVLDDRQKALLVVLRNQAVFPKGAYLYSDPIAMPVIPDTSFLFAR